MRIEFLGVGSFFSKRHHHNNLLVNDTVLIDCGFTAGRSLHESDRTFADIEHVFITHTHGDHIGGLEELGFYSRYVVGGRKPNLYLPEALSETLWAHSLRGSMEDAESGASSLADYFTVHIVGPEFRIEDTRFRIVPTHHVTGKFCCGLVIDDRVYFSGDTRFDPATVIRHGAGARVVFHECEFVPSGIHTPLSSLETLPEDIRTKTYLMHYGDTYEAHADRVAAAGFRFARQHQIYEL